jgi:uncharacterized membrane protein
MNIDTEFRDFGKSRVEALTDGIFAIAMTVLVLTIEVPRFQPGATDVDMMVELRRLLPSFLAFMASFVTLGLFWVGHHNVMRFVERVDRNILWAHLYFLMAVSLVPFTTSLYSREATSRIANALFGTNLILLALLTLLIWRYCLRRPGYVTEELPEKLRIYVTRRIVFLPAIPVLAMIVSLVQPHWAEFVYFAMIPLYMASRPFAGPSESS